MTEAEIRAKALECAAKLPRNPAVSLNDYDRTLLERAERFAVYIRLGMEAVEGMLR